MQIDSIKIADYIKTGEQSDSVQTKSSVDKSDDGKNIKELKALKVNNAYYDKNGKRADEEEDTKNQINSAAELGMNTINEVNNMSKNIDEETVSRLTEDGFDPMDLDANTIVTVADKIKLELAKSGVDISKMGGLDERELQAMGLTRGIEDSLSEEVKKYLVVNELEPTILNIYNASYSAPSPETGAVAGEMPEDELVDLLGKLADKLDELIQQAEGASKDVAAQMLKHDIPLTKDNMEYMVKLNSFEKPDDEQIITAMEDIAKEGKNPEDAYLIEGYSLMDQAREAVDEVKSIDLSTIHDITIRRQLEEVRLEMTVEATFTMIKNGIDVNTNDISQLIENLKIQEMNLLKMLMKEDGEKLPNNALEIYQETMDSIADINNTPVQLFGQFSNISQATLSEVHTVSVSITAEYTRMEMTYEAVGTEVRKDLGDNINKAFRNVDDILNELEIEPTEASEKAVRILAYNQMEINKESVEGMRDTAELVGRTFKNMTPAVVTEMIKRGENPLDMKIGELKIETEAIKTELSGSSDSEEFAKFLWKMEHTQGISEEERDSYIGIYRLLNQVEKTDGAAIGALISQGSEITLRNLMTAVRSQKHSGKEYEVSDKTGVIDELVVKDLSITEQVEKAFMTNRCRDAREAMTPAKMQEVGQEIFMEMDPDEFAEAMEARVDDATEQAYAKDITEQIKAAIEADKTVFQIIEELKLPTSVNMISAVEAMINDNNKAIKDLYNRIAKIEKMSIEELIEMTTERFGEACKTPEEMAEAQEALGVLAENCMKTMIETEDVQTIDMDGMKLIINQTKVYGEMAKSDELYHIPIMVADEAGTLNLKIVRGTNESGLIKMALYMQNTGAINASFRYEKDLVDVKINCETNEMREAFAADAPIIAQEMQEETGFSYSFSFGQDRGISANELYLMETGNMEVTDDKTNEIQTEALYGIARGFIKVMSEMFS